MAAFETSTIYDSFEALSKLLYPPVQQEERAASSTAAAAGPGSVGPAYVAQDVTIPAPKPRRDIADIWEDEEIALATEDDLDDGRRQPSYEFIYKQAVGTTDAFLGLSDKDPSSTCCEDLVLTISLPGTKSLAELDLDVQPTRVQLRSPLYKLALPLPHKVDEKQGSAKWDAKKEMLCVTLRIVRDFFD
ncbi:hypothetical protein WJX72_011800 [[Myrmecia] bisecta]|uniref:PIH1D1/2/3 CS-like domain-containing protein n=1 Tax=[Myrmecia] bisecta TaxID=41462 RepID=A0AAW1QT35_9CHLO